jgi:hypothetical protein
MVCNFRTMLSYFGYASYILGNVPLQFSVSSCVVQITDSRASLIVSRAIVA